MTWFKRNIRAETWITIIVIVIGFVATNAVKAYKQDELEVNDKKQDVAITLNTNHRIVSEAEPEHATKQELTEAKDAFKIALNDVKETNQKIYEYLLTTK